MQNQESPKLVVCIFITEREKEGERKRERKRGREKQREREKLRESKKKKKKEYRTNTVRQKKGYIVDKHTQVDNKREAYNDRNMNQEEKINA